MKSGFLCFRLILKSFTLLGVLQTVLEGVF